MPLSQILQVMVFAIGMGIGQLFLKLSSSIYNKQQINDDLVSKFIGLITNWAFWVGGSIYVVLFVYWIWLLTFIPLSRAYPFTLFSFFIAALGSNLFFGERLSFVFLIGLAFISIGLLILSCET